MTRKRYSHAYDIAFEVDSNDPKGASAEELLSGLSLRLSNLREQFRRYKQQGAERAGGPEIEEACGLPFDTEDREGED